MRTSRKLAVIARPRILLAMVLILGVLAAQASGGTLAYFTATSASTGNTFSAGTIALKLSDTSTANGGVAETTEDAITLSISGSLMKPGMAAITAPITVTNTGTLTATYSLAYTAADSGFQPQDPGNVAATPTQFLKLQVKVKGTGDGDASTCTTANFGVAAKWESSIFGASSLTTAGADIITAGSPRTLGAAAGEVLCMQVTFPDSGLAGTENAAQGGTSTIAFNFSGRQE